MGQPTRADIWEKHADELIRFATGVVGPSDAQDVMAAAVVRAMWSRSWPDVENHRAFLYRAVLNEARSQARSAMRRRARERKAAATAPTVVHVPEVRPDILEAVGRLSVRQRAVVFLTYWDGLTPDGVARVLGISEGSVRRHLARARARLRRLIDE